MHPAVSDSVPILGIEVHRFPSYAHVLGLIGQRIRAQKQTFCIAINPEKVYAAARNPQLKKVLCAADIRLCDGIGISLASLLLHHRPIPRCTGIDLFANLMHFCETEGFKVFVLGASPEANRAGCDALVQAHPHLKLVGRHHGFFNEVEPVIESINRSDAELLFVAMGSPRQEFWLQEQMPRLKPRFCMGIGGSLDVISGAVKRAPALFRESGTEWLFRLISQPSRIRRQAVLPAFAVEVLRSMCQARARA